MNKCIFYGNLARDPEVFTTQNNEKMVKIVIATHRVVNGERKTEFLPCLAFRKTAELLEQHYQKGRAIIVEARAANSRGKTKNGEEYNTVVFLIERFEFASAPRKEQQHQTTQQEKYQQGERQSGVEHENVMPEMDFNDIDEELLKNFDVEDEIEQLPF